MGKFDFVKPSPLSATSTYPRQSSASGSGSNSTTSSKAPQPKKPTRLDLSGINHSNGATSKAGLASAATHRTTTLPHRRNNIDNHSAMSTVFSSADSPDSNPLRILRDKNFPIVRPRVKPNAQHARDCHDDDQTVAQLSPCESPSYILHTTSNGHHDKAAQFQAYTFSERDLHAATADENAAGGLEHPNPVPLPPRDRNKVMQTNVKRHVRKYPLIIPVSGLQRNLTKMTASSPSPVDEDGAAPFPYATAGHRHEDVGDAAVVQKHHAATEAVAHTQNGDLMQRFIENNFPAAGHQHHPQSPAHFNHRTYENMDTLRHMQQQQQQHQHHQQQYAIDCTDSASLHFESILEDGCHRADAIGSPEANKADFMFDIQKDHQLYRQKAAAAAAAQAADVHDAPDEIRNLDIEAKKLEFAQRYPAKYSQSQSQHNELANHSLFNKVKEMAEVSATTSDRNATIAAGVDQVDTTTTNSSAAAAVVEVGAPAAQTKESNEDDEVDAGPSQLSNSNSVSCEDLLEFSDQKPKGRERGVESDEVRIMTKVLGGMVRIIDSHACMIRSTC